MQVGGLSIVTSLRAQLTKRRGVIIFGRESFVSISHTMVVTKLK